tara:strand:- start:37483 stop:38511 length:1029 start_codon:yes stop_codon:yes gene_type:complete
MLSTNAEYYMGMALKLAELGRFTTQPNPMVGCVIVKDETVVGTGFHIRAGEPHAEIHALNMAGSNAKGADVYVTLEPCTHHGRTGPCCDALMAAGIKSVIIATHDPNPVITSKGEIELSKAGIDIYYNVLRQQALDINRFYFHRFNDADKPYVIAKWAMTNDGLLTRPNSPYITGELAREHIHQLRQLADAILVGANTIRHDNPQLTNRLKHIPDELRRQPKRIILSSDASFKTNARVFNGEYQQLTQVISPSDNPDFLTQLKNNNINTLIVEGGGITLDYFFEQGWVDEIHVYIADCQTNSVDAIRQAAFIQDKHQFTMKETQQLGPDTFIRARIIQTGDT